MKTKNVINQLAALACMGTGSMAHAHDLPFLNASSKACRIIPAEPALKWVSDAMPPSEEDAWKPGVKLLPMQSVVFTLPEGKDATTHLFEIHRDPVPFLASEAADREAAPAGKVAALLTPLRPGPGSSCSLALVPGTSQSAEGPDGLNFVLDGRVVIREPLPEAPPSDPGHPGPSGPASGYGHEEAFADSLEGAGAAVSTQRVTQAEGLGLLDRLVQLLTWDRQPQADGTGDSGRMETKESR